jgi:hypothetical protein
MDLRTLIFLSLKFQKCKCESVPTQAKVRCESEYAISVITNSLVIGALILSTIYILRVISLNSLVCCSK